MSATTEYKAAKWDELRHAIDFYESGVDDDGSPVEDKDLIPLLVRRVEKVVFADWHTTPTRKK